MPVNKVSAITQGTRAKRIPIRRAHSFSDNMYSRSKESYPALNSMSFSGINFRGSCCVYNYDESSLKQILKQGIKLRDDWQTQKDNLINKDDFNEKLETINKASREEEFKKHGNMELIRPQRRNVQGRIIQQKKILGNLTKGADGLQYLDYDSGSVYTVMKKDNKTLYSLVEDPELSGISKDCQPVVRSFKRGFLLDDNLNISRYEENYRGRKFCGLISNTEKDCCTKTIEESGNTLLCTLSKVKFGVVELFETYEISPEKLNYTKEFNGLPPRNYSYDFKNNEWLYCDQPM